MRFKFVFVALVTVGSGLGMERYNGWCDQGGQKVKTTGNSSSTFVMASFPTCLVTVFQTGTFTPATIYADNAGTVLSNPFTADAFGHYFFYAVDGRYDVTMVGGTPSPGVSAWTQGDILLQDGGGGGGGGGTVVSVGLAVPTWLSVTGSPINSAGTLTVSAATGQTANRVIGTGSGSSFGPVALTTADLPFTYGGNTTKLVTTTGGLTSTHCVNIDASGNFVDSGAVCGSGGTGTVTSVGFSASSGFVVGGSPITTTGTVTLGMPTGWTTGSLLTGAGANQVQTLLVGGADTFLQGGSTPAWSSIPNSDDGTHAAKYNTSTHAWGSQAIGSVTSVAATVPSWLAVAGSPITTSGTLAISAAGSQTSHRVVGTFSGSSVSLGALTTADLPLTYTGNTTKAVTSTGATVNGNCANWDANGNLVDSGGTCGAGSGGGTVTSVAFTAPTGFNVTGSPVAGAGTIALAMPTSWATGDLLIGNGGASVTRLAIGTNGQCLTSNGTTGVWGTCASTAGTVTSVALSFPGFTVSGSPVTTSGTLTVANPLTTEGDMAYLHSSAWTRLGVGSNAQCLKSNGTIPTWGSCGTGTVTSTALAAPTGFTVSGSPITTSGTLTLGMPAGWSAGDLLLGNGANSVARLPVGVAGAALVSNGTTAGWGAVGSVSSVALALPPQFTVSGSPITSSGTITGSWATVAAHRWLGNATGGTTTPTFSVIGVADLPFTYSNPVNTKLATTTGTLVAGDCVSIGSAGDLVDSGVAGCGSGGGGGITTVPNGGTGLTSGASGGVPYFSGVTTMASSALLALNTVVVGGGLGGAPHTTGVTVDVSNNVGTTGTLSTGVGSGLSGALVPKPGTLSQAGSCSGATEGTIAPITDSTTNTWGATITGSGAFHVLGYCDGSVWSVMAK
jgi:hypothetical protein